MAAEHSLKRASRNRAAVSGVSTASAASLSTLPEEELLEAVQRQTFNFFWEGAHPQSGLALDAAYPNQGSWSTLSAHCRTQNPCARSSLPR
jgi:hypothetical protein